ncbi:hypothetical protein CGC20_30975 [Leishmania donovani]|uniref:Sister chromatid cohesion protein n=1 Tax=Leishmania donovani TaxID=5661 RepID=A0A504WTE7_LEIDO|nr:hypothetical protein CGC20_30975 [Leishmania donovani]
MPAALSVDELRATPDSRLLSYLMNAYDSVRGFSLAAPSTAPCPGSTPFSATYVEELLTPRLLSSPIPDVSQLTAGAESLPFPRERCADVLHCICTCFARLPSSPMNASPSSAAHQRPSLQRVAYLIERAAAAHIFRHLLPHCSLASEETQQALRWVFEAVRCASSAPAGELGNRGSVGTPTSTATCGEMAQVLRDIICCTSVVTPAHLVPLLDELVVASPTLRLMSLSASSSSSFSACAPSARQNRHLPAHCGSSGALITTRLLLEQMDMLQPAIATWAMGEFEEGLAEEAQLIHKRRGLQVMAHVLEVLVALIELHVDLAEQLLPALAPHLEHTCPEVRLLLLRGLSAAFAANEAAVRSYRAAFMGPLLNRFLDVKPNIRMEAVRLSTMLLQRFGNHARPGADRDDRHAIGLSTNLSRMQSLQQDLWKAFQPCWERLLADPHVLVRRQAVASVTEAALAAPLLLQPTPHSESIDNRDLRGGQQATPSLTRSPSNFLAQTLGLRALDKNRRVRCAAVDGLTRLYSEYRLVWIPNAVLDAVRIDAGSSLSSTAPATLTAETVVEGLLPAPFSCLSPTSATCAAAATQATLTQWLSPTSPAALPLTKTPALLDFERNALEEKQLSQQHPPGGDEFDEGDALLGFGASASSTKAVTGGGLCQHVDSAHFAQLLRLSEKKPQLRLAIRRLFEFHAAVKESNGDVKSAEGQQRIHSIHRLLTFLQETTGARKGEWDALFRAKDETVRRALLRACDAAHTDWVEVRKGLLRSLHGRISADEFAFVKQTLMPQMVFAVKPAHLAGLMQRLHRSIYTSARNEVVVDGAGAAGALRALLLLTAASPSFAALSTEGLVEALQAAAKQSVGPPPNWCGLLLQALQRWATATATMADRNTTATTAATSALHDSLIATLRAMALASLPMQQTIPSSLASTAFARDNDSCRDGTAFSAVKQLAKQATRTLVALLRVPGYNTSAAAALHSLASELAKRLASGRALINDVKTVAWLASDVCGKAGQSRLKALATASAAAANTTAAATMPACGARSSSPVSTNMPVTAAIVDGSAKAMVALVLSCPKSSDAGGSSTGVASRANSVICAVDALLKGYKASVAVASGRRGPASIGSCHCRIALQKQLVKLLLTPTPDIGRELAVSVVLSVEESAHVRHAVQAKLAGHLLHRTCDMRVAALLLLTAISEDSKSSYHRLRGLVETVGDHLRAKQVSQGASLSSPSALYCYWEYTIPFLVLFLAHHPYYASEEAENQFVGFQRVWHLLIGELLRHGTQCAGFVVELLSKIKQSDDALAPGSDACRVMCDLASRVLLECLGQRQSRAEDLRRYPGAVLLPSFFVRTSRSNPQKLLETVFLDQGVRVTANAPFRMPTVSGGAAGAGSGSRGSSLQATPRASSTALSRGADGATDINHVSSSAAPYGDEVAEGDEGSMPQRECTEPAVGESANNSDPLSDSAIASQEWNAKRAALQRLTVEEALDDLFCGLTKTAIAQLRWKVVRSRIEEALRALDCSRLPQQPQPRITNEGTGADLMVTKGASLLECDMENLLQYAKDQLRVRYDRAPA